MRIGSVELFPALATMVTSCAALTARGGELTSRDVIEAAKAAMKSIESVQGTFRTYFATLRGPGVVKGPDGPGPARTLGKIGWRGKEL